MGGKAFHHDAAIDGQGIAWIAEFCGYLEGVKCNAKW
jgi:hypothetical protein